MPTAIKVKKRHAYIPSPSCADAWITPEVYKVRKVGYFRILPDMTIIREYVNKRRNKGGNHA